MVDRLLAMANQYLKENKMKLKKKCKPVSVYLIMLIASLSVKMHLEADWIALDLSVQSQFVVRQ